MLWSNRCVKLFWFRDSRRGVSVEQYFDVWEFNLGRFACLLLATPAFGWAVPIWLIGARVCMPCSCAALAHTLREIILCQRLDGRRMIVFDMDSTLIQQEVIDELAAVSGVGAEAGACLDKGDGGGRGGEGKGEGPRTAPGPLRT